MYQDFSTHCCVATTNDCDPTTTVSSTKTLQITVSLDSNNITNDDSYGVTNRQTKSSSFVIYFLHLLLTVFVIIIIIIIIATCSAPIYI